MEEKPTQSRKGVKGQRPLWGLGQRPNCSTGDQSQGSQQQRRRQRSVPASNFALPQERPPSCSTHYLHIVAPNGRDHIAAPPHLALASPPPNGYPTPKGYKKNQRCNSAGFFNLQKYSLLQLRQMNPQEHQHVRHKLARCGARFMRRGIPPRQGAVKRNVLLLPRLVDGRANRAFYRQRRRAVSPRNGWVDFHRHAARLNGLTQEIQNRIHKIVEAGQTRRHAERRQQTGNFPLRRDLRFRQGQLRRLRAGGCSARRQGRHGMCGLNGLRCLCALHRSAKRDERNCLLYREPVHLRRH